MSERPILFSGPMIRAIIEGQKTQTRRVVKGTALDWLNSGFMPEFVAYHRNSLCKYGQPGDLLWVRETWRAWERDDGLDHIHYRADDAKIKIPNTIEAGDFVVGRFDRWYPSIHMPRWASRITLEITGVRIERLQDITDDDARAEGVAEWARGALSPEGQHNICRQDGFRMLWEQINGYESWNANPWVWVIKFKRTESST